MGIDLNKERRVRKLWQEGAPDSSIAAQFGLTERDVYRFRVRKDYLSDRERSSRRRFRRLGIGVASLGAAALVASALLYKHDDTSLHTAVTMPDMLETSRDHSSLELLVGKFASNEPIDVAFPIVNLDILAEIDRYKQTRESLSAQERQRVMKDYAARLYNGDLKIKKMRFSDIADDWLQVGSETHYSAYENDGTHLLVRSPSRTDLLKLDLECFLKDPKTLGVGYDRLMFFLKTSGHTKDNAIGDLLIHSLANYDGNLNATARDSFALQMGCLLRRTALPAEGTSRMFIGGRSFLKQGDIHNHNDGKRESPADLRGIGMVAVYYPKSNTYEFRQLKNQACIWSRTVQMPESVRDSYLSNVYNKPLDITYRRGPDLSRLHFTFTSDIGIQGIIGLVDGKPSYITGFRGSKSAQINEPFGKLNDIMVIDVHGNVLHITVKG